MTFQHAYVIRDLSYHEIAIQCEHCDKYHKYWVRSDLEEMTWAQFYDEARRELKLANMNQEECPGRTIPLKGEPHESSLSSS